MRTSRADTARLLEVAAARDTLLLLDWRRRIFDLYREIRSSDDPRRAWRRWREVREELFATHPQSPLPEAKRSASGGLDYYAYDPDARTLAEVVPAEPDPLDIETSLGDTIGFVRFAIAAFALYGENLELELYWLQGYGGGLFLPFGDKTNGETTYGAGRYLLDTVKGADLGGEGGRLVVDFNFAYNPSCAYEHGWPCPLVPAANRLSIPVPAGERVS